MKDVVASAAHTAVALMGATRNFMNDCKKSIEQYPCQRINAAGCVHCSTHSIKSTIKVTESSISYISKSLRSGRTVHSTVMSSSREFLEQRLRSSPYLMEMIVRLFYHDYTLLGYPLPNL